MDKVQMDCGQELRSSLEPSVPSVSFSSGGSLLGDSGPFDHNRLVGLRTNMEHHGTLSIPEPPKLEPKVSKK